MIRRTGLAAAIAVSALVIGPARISADGLPPGQHTASPKYWSEVPAYVTNFTPTQFDFRIDNLTPGRSGDLWFSVGSSLEHIDADNALRSFPMPYSEWRVSGIAPFGDGIVFSAGQSGKFGFVGPGGAVHYIQVVPRRDFPDLRDLFASSSGEIWFLDYGRASVGYRAADGRVVERPFPDKAYPTRLQHCMGKLWAIAIEPNTGSHLYTFDDSLHPVPYLQVTSDRQQVVDMTCDRKDRLWLVTGYANASIVRFDGLGDRKTFDIAPAAMAPDAHGGMWILGSGSGPRANLIHVAPDSAMQRYTLPTSFGGETVIAASEDGTVWSGDNDSGSPIGVTRISPHR